MKRTRSARANMWLVWWAKKQQTPTSVLYDRVDQRPIRERLDELLKYGGTARVTGTR
jgi:hypothetical protein